MFSHNDMLKIVIIILIYILIFIELGLTLEGNFLIKFYELLKDIGIAFKNMLCLNSTRRHKLNSKLPDPNLGEINILKWLNVNFNM